MSFLSRFVNVFRSSRVDERLDEELHFHVEERTRALIEAGHSPDEAARRARRALGNALVLRERSREGFFAVVSLVLTAMGVYGMLTYSVVHRMPEIGIRVALGAGAAAVARAVLGEMLVVVLAGLGIGLATGLAFSRFVRAILYEASPYDPISLAVPAAILLAAAVVATVMPLRRAVRVDPIVALRCD